jgi:hypothetical protein
MSPLKKVLAKVTPFHNSKPNKDTDSHKTGPQKQQANGDASSAPRSGTKRQPSVEKLEKHQQRELEDEAARKQRDAKFQEIYERVSDRRQVCMIETQKLMLRP